MSNTCLLPGIAGTRGQEAEATTTTTAAAAGADGAVTTTTAAAAAENAEETPVAGEVYLCWKNLFNISVRQIYLKVLDKYILTSVSDKYVLTPKHQWKAKMICVGKICFSFYLFRRHSRHKRDGCKLSIVYM